jgi:hypothetical protein
MESFGVGVEGVHSICGVHISTCILVECIISDSSIFCT